MGILKKNVSIRNKYSIFAEILHVQHKINVTFIKR